MGSSNYSFSSRATRSASMGYDTKSTNDIFEQNKKRVIHESMQPKTALLRESRDSENHPHSVPIILGVDVTGSMGRIPHYFVKEGLPKMIQKIIDSGIEDPQVLFLAVGDHENDRHPLQVGQFESGDVELDLWLTRTYIEGGGGGNGGESYSLAWYYAAKHTIIDSFEKRNQKGFLFTIGDEPCLRMVPNTVIEELMGEKPETSYSDAQLLAMAQEQYHVFHLHIMEGNAGQKSLGYWQNLLGDHCIQVDNYHDVDRLISETVAKYVSLTAPKIIKKKSAPFLKHKTVL